MAACSPMLLEGNFANAGILIDSQKSSSDLSRRFA
jgi:hypothetical protein